MRIFYSYNNLIDFIDDIIKNKKIWTKYGLIHSFSINNINESLSPKYISLFIRNNNIIQNLNKYIFTIDEFKTVVFSNQVHGIEMYKNKNSTKTTEQIINEWNDLSDVNKKEYLDLGLKLTDDLDRYPTFIFPDIITNPTLPEELVSLEVLNLSQIFGLNTGLHKFVLNDEILFNIYFDYAKTEFIITNMSSIITNSKDNQNTINVYIENSNAYIQNMLQESVYIKKYSNYL